MTYFQVIGRPLNDFAMDFRGLENISLLLVCLLMLLWVGLLTPFWDVKWVFAEVRGPLLA